MMVSTIQESVGGVTTFLQAIQPWRRQLPKERKFSDRRDELDLAGRLPYSLPMSIWIQRVYTKTGDRGETALVGGKMVPKDSARIDAYGTVDELNACLGLLRQANRTEPGPQGSVARLDAILERIQNELFNLGSLLATLPEDLGERQPRIEARHVERLEQEIDELNEGLPPLRSFTLPGGGFTSSYLHLARTVCRRAERSVVHLSHEAHVDAEAVRYLNRLSDALYVFGRWNTRERGETEPLWRPETT
jgi:cob(I)alamin adenosyltransferase